MADSHPFANAGLGMFGSAEKKYAAAGMSGGDSNDTEFLGGLLKFMGVGDETVQSVKDFAKNPFASSQPTSNSQQTSNTQYQPAPYGGVGLKPTWAGTAPPEQDGQPFSGQGIYPTSSYPTKFGQPPSVNKFGSLPALGQQPVYGTPDANVWNPEVERAKTQQILQGLVPRNLSSGGQ